MSMSTAPGSGRLNSSFPDLVRTRRSCRRFLPDPIEEDVIRELLSDAMWSPSNCNTQPWKVHVASGLARDRVVAGLLEAEAASAPHPDFSFDATAYSGEFGARRQEQGATYHQALGVERSDYRRRRAVSLENLHLFGAPHVAFLFMPKIGDSVRVGADVGMFAQTFLLALASRGLAGTPQTTLGLFPEAVRSALGLTRDWKLLFGISFGRPDRDAPAANFTIGRAPIEEVVNVHVT